MGQQFQNIDYEFDRIGNDLNYNLVYNYDRNYTHRLISIGERHYKYDANGNLVCEKDGSFDEEEVTYSRVVNEEAENIYSANYGWGLYSEGSANALGDAVYRCTYTWNEKNQLISIFRSFQAYLRQKL